MLRIRLPLHILGCRHNANVAVNRETETAIGFVGSLRVQNNPSIFEMQR